MPTLAFARAHRVVRLAFDPVVTRDDLESMDRELVAFLSAEAGDGPAIRGLYDMTAVQALAAPQPYFAWRAGLPAIGGMLRVVIAPPWAGEEFGRSYRDARALWAHDQPRIVGSAAEAHALLDIVDPVFESVRPSEARP